MMSALCIYVEDLEADSRMWGAYLRKAWGLLAPNQELKVKTIASVEEALELIEDPSQAEPDFVVVDLLFRLERESTERGLAVLEAASSRWPSVPRIALSVADHSAEHRAKNAGANVFLSKTALVRSGEARRLLAEGIRAAFSAHRREARAVGSVELKVDATSLRLSAVVEFIGKSVLGALIEKLIEATHGQRPVEMKVAYIRAGLSGAMVFRVQSRVPLGSDERGRDRIEKVLSHLVKVSRDDHTLRAEVEGREKARGFPATVIPIDGTELVRVDGWSAILMPFLEAVTALDFAVASRDGSAGSRRMLDTLWGVDMRRVLEDSTEDPEAQPQERLWGDLVSPRTGRILESMDELEQIAKRCLPALKVDLATARAFVTARRLGGLDARTSPRGLRTVLCHGDLHARNVLVDAAGRPFLVDLANVRPLHWAADIARFFVDLLVSGLDSGPDENLWERVPAWLEVSEGLVTWVPRAGQNHVVVAPGAAEFQWLLENWGAVLGDLGAAERVWEWLACVAAELLRATYRKSELSPQKRVLALVLAERAIRASEAMCPK